MTPQPGQSHPLGPTIRPDGVNFSVFSKHAEAMELVLFADADAEPSRVVPLDPATHRTGDYWHVAVPGLGPGQLYGFRARGPWEPRQGLRFDGDKLLLDPYAKAVAVGRNYRRAAAVAPGDNAAAAMKSVVVDRRAYDWEEDRPLGRPVAETVIYELHVRGFTRHPSSGAAPERRGTYASLADKIPYLKDLGVTAVELLPVFQFDPQEAPEGLTNYWGYSPVSFFAPHLGYSSLQDPWGAVCEFRDMVKAFHRAGLEVILDVVYNHTAEAGRGDATFCFRGLGDGTYYLLDGVGGYRNYSGTGNTMNANQAVVRRLILDSLRYWVEEMHVDGFRFDLASILSRDERGRPMDSPPILWSIESDPILAGTKLIAEAWDAAGLYQVGSFIGDRFLEWNGRFRDDVRRFVRGDPGAVPRLADRLFASPDVYAHEAREAQQSVNFVTCHDGFTLNDLVSYDRKHNEANGQGDRDGTDDNLSWNCGVEGPSDDPEVEALRRRQIKNLLVINLLALGTPMLLMGDEMRRTQGGNNNPYCQDNETSWLDWTLLERHRGLHRFVRGLIRLRRGLAAGIDWTLPLTELLSRADIRWHGVRLDRPDRAPHSRSLAAQVTGPGRVFTLYGAFNAFWRPLDFELPPTGSPADRWRRVIDTSLEPPEDFREPEGRTPEGRTPDGRTPEQAPAVDGPLLRVAPRSVALLMGG